jgi:hypothetical protein
MKIYSFSYLFHTVILLSLTQLHFVIEKRAAVFSEMTVNTVLVGHIIRSLGHSLPGVIYIGKSLLPLRGNQPMSLGGGM